MSTGKLGEVANRVQALPSEDQQLLPKYHTHQVFQCIRYFGLIYNSFSGCLYSHYHPHVPSIESVAGESKTVLQRKVCETLIAMLYDFASMLLFAVVAPYTELSCHTSSRPMSVMLFPMTLQSSGQYEIRLASFCMSSCMPTATLLFCNKVLFFTVCVHCHTSDLAATFF